ncbi:MAG TPA: hypothetical protein VIO64_14225 [Pseudobacteroides sp.]|uniref:hypothetical protein n=1 Tax=Pseudobacteroides sp. TaxID=1968840 RepID=UPI002F93F5AD
MLINTCLTMGYKCNFCGSFEFFNISLFRLLGKRAYTLTCRCNNSKITIFNDNLNEFKIRTPCIGCGSNHIFTLSRNELLVKPVSVLHCPGTGIELSFIGTDEEVRKRIDRLEKEFDELIDLFGYDKYFKNTQVMFDALNKIHDIAENGNLYCECGSNEVEMLLYEDGIHLKCLRCFANVMIDASSNKDLKDILKRHQIMLTKEPNDFAQSPSKQFVRKTDDNQF